MARTFLFTVVFWGMGAAWAIAQGDALPERWRWKSSPPLVEIVENNLPLSPDNPWHAVKDPSIVRHERRWHLFCTLRKRDGGEGKPPGYIRIGYLSFADWKDVATARWELLDLTLDYHSAPQVFWFEAHKKWYLIYQLADEARGIEYGPCFSTTENLADPKSWTKPAPFYRAKPEHVSGWLDFWIICDKRHAHLFFTSLDGRMWRADTALDKFPQGFGDPNVALEGDIFEASHTYRLKGREQYLTLIEAQGAGGGKGQRYYKSYVADTLEGPWREQAASAEMPFAGATNVDWSEPRWSDSISHGELIRAGFNQQLEVDPKNLQFLFQGLHDDTWNQGYGKLRWRLGLLEAVAGE